MALSINGNLIIDEEFRNPSTGDPDNEVTALSASGTLITYLNGLNATPDTGFPQYAERDDMIVGFPSGATLSLVADNSGTPFSTTVGIPTGFTDIDGDAISLYQADAAHPNVIVGKDAGGEVSFAIVLDGAKVYVVQYQPLFHDTAGSVDSADVHDLTGLIFVQATSTVTTTLNFSDFSDVASGQDEFAMIAPDTAPPGQQGDVQFLVTGVSDTGTHSTVNVSTQGGFNGSLGTGAQSTGVNESLIFDLVTGGDVTISNTEAHNAANIDFANHVTGFREAGFGIVQTNPNNASVDVLLTAYDVKAASDTTDGAAFITASLDPATQQKVVIDSVTIIQKDGTTNTYTQDTPGIVDFQNDGSVIINNLKDDWLVEFTTTSDLDRFVVKNAGTGNEQFDIGRLSATSSSSTTTNEFADLGAHLIYEDDGPVAALAINANTFVTVDETLGQNPGETESGSLGAVTVTGAVLFSLTGTDGGADQLKPNSTTFALALGSGDGTDSGLDDTLTGQNIVLVKVNDHLVEGHVGSAAGALAFSVAITDSGDVTLTQNRAVIHNDPTDPDETGSSAATFSAGALTATATVLDKDNDPDASTAVDLGLILRLEDDGPTITVAPVSLDLDNTASPITGSASFGYDLNSDLRTYPGATAFTSDFVDSNAALTGVQLALSGTVGTGPDNTISNTNVTLQSETDTSAVFNFSFDYDTNPQLAGVQTATATGTLSFNKSADTYTVTLDNPIEGFSFDVLHTSGLLDKNPTGNTGHPPIVVEKLDTDFFVQFTADTTALSFSTTGDTANTGDTAFTGSAHDLAGGTETWVSATQSTNGVAGDTIQKGELLTLRFFEEDILSDATPPVTEKVDPTAEVSGLAIKFDGIGHSEDLILILDLIDDQGTADTSDDVEITRAVVVDNADIIRKSTPGGVPAPYNTEFSLDNNDGLVIIESNDYNASGENYQIQGVQIMQSANGLTGSGINLNGATGSTGASDTSVTQSFDSGHTNDVLKITDIGFITTTNVSQDADLDFAFQIVDGDGDPTTTQHLSVGVLNA